MSQLKSELAQAREELNFWQELVVHLRLPERGILQALEHASTRYDRALQRCVMLQPAVTARAHARAVRASVRTL